MITWREQLYDAAKALAITSLFELDDLADQLFGHYEMLTDDIQAVWRRLEADRLQAERTKA